MQKFDQTNLKIQGTQDALPLNISMKVKAALILSNVLYYIYVVLPSILLVSINFNQSATIERGTEYWNEYKIQCKILKIKII